MALKMQFKLSDIIYKLYLYYLTSVKWSMYSSDSSGMAFLSGMCSEEASCTIAETRSLGATALISKSFFT